MAVHPSKLTRNDLNFPYSLLECSYENTIIIHIDFC